MVATFDGRFMPAMRPNISTAPRRAHNGVSIVHSKRAQPPPIRDRAMVPLCRIRDETKPADTEPINTPIDPKRNMEPAWLWDSPSSLLIAGIRGAKIYRLMKVRKKSSVRKRTLPITPLKGSGTGHSLSDT
jgi:hypothetical protein